MIGNKVVIAAILSILALPAIAARDHAVRGHVKKDGTYVAPTRATNPNSTQRDNYSSKPNTNPLNGRQGTREATK